MTTRPTATLLATLTLLAIPLVPSGRFAQQAAGASLVGKKVVTRKGTELKVDGKVVYDEGHAAALKQGRDRRLYHIYKVRESQGDEVWLSTDDAIRQGWTPASNVIPLEQAVAYFDEPNDEGLEAYETALVRAKIWRELGDAARAIEKCNAAIQHAPGGYKYAYMFRGTLHAETLNYDQAIADFTRAIKIDHHASDAYADRARVLLLAGRPEKALTDLSRAIEIEPNSALAHFNRGIALEKLGEKEKAYDAYSQALKNAPGFAPAYVARASLALILVSRIGKYEWVLPDLDEAIRLDPGLACAYMIRGHIWNSKSEFRKALDDFDKAIELDPNQIDSFCGRGLVWGALKEHQKAADDLSAVIRINPNQDGPLDNRARAWSSLGEQEKAIADLNRLIGLHPHRATWRLRRGMTRIAAGDFARAAYELDAIILIDRSNPTAHYLRGVVAFELGDFDRAIADASVADAFGYPDAPVFRLRGDAWLAKLDCEKAAANYDWAAMQDPPDHDALNGLAWILATAPGDHVRDGGRAVTAATRACELTNWKIPDHLATLAAALAEAGDFENAQERQQEAIDLTEANSSARRPRVERLALYRTKSPYRMKPAPQAAHDALSKAERGRALSTLAVANLEAEYKRADDETKPARSVAKPDPKPGEAVYATLKQALVAP